MICGTRYQVPGTRYHSEKIKTKPQTQNRAVPPLEARQPYAKKYPVVYFCNYNNINIRMMLMKTQSKQPRIEQLKKQNRNRADKSIIQKPE